MATRKKSTRRIVIETLVVVGIFGVVHLPIYPPYGDKAEKTAAAPVAALPDCPTPAPADGKAPADCKDSPAQAEAAARD